jgi:hypothetical protein
VQDTTTNGEGNMTAVLIMTETGTQYPIDPEGVENMIKEYEVLGKRTNGAQVYFWFRSEYPCSIVANWYSESCRILDEAYREARKKKNQKNK